MTNTSAGNNWAEDEDMDETQTDDTDADETETSDSGADETDDSDSTETSSTQDDDSSSDPADDGGDGAQTLADAAPHEVDAHRNLIGDTLQHLSEQGIDIEELAENAGVESADVNELTHGDLASITKYIGEHHPEALQEIGDHYPAAQGLLGVLTNGGGIFNRLFGR